MEEEHRARTRLPFWLVPGSKLEGSRTGDIQRTRSALPGLFSRAKRVDIEEAARLQRARLSPTCSSPSNFPSCSSLYSLLHLSRTLLTIQSSQFTNSTSSFSPLSQLQNARPALLPRSSPARRYRKGHLPYLVPLEPQQPLAPQQPRRSRRPQLHP